MTRSVAQTVATTVPEAASVRQRATTYMRWIVPTMFAVTLVMSHCLWLSTRDYPLSPVLSFLPQPPFPLDYILFGVMLLALLGTAALGTRFFMDIAIAIGLIWAVLDQSRWQPWFASYLLVLLCLRLGADGAREGSSDLWAMLPVQLFTCVMYIYSGLHKLHYRYFTTQFGWMAEPLFTWLHVGLPRTVVVILAIGSAALETTLGILLLFGRTRRAAVLVLTAMHVYILLMIGPVGRNYNMVVWPWNIAAIATLWCLFWPKGEQFTVLEELRRPNPSQRRRSKSVQRGSRSVAFVCVGVLILFGIFPVLSFWDRWDAYLSFELYAGKERLVVLYFDPAQSAKLPPMATKVARREGEVDLFAWALEELNAVPIQEERVALNIGRSLAIRAPDAGMKMAISSSPGLVSGRRTISLYAFPGPNHQPVNVTRQYRIQMNESS